MERQSRDVGTTDFACQFGENIERMPSKHPVWRRNWRWVLVLALASASAACHKQKVQAPPSTPVQKSGNPPPEMAPPEVSGTPEKTPPTLTVPEPKPAPPKTRPRPRPTDPEPIPEPAVAKPDPPRLTPRYTPEEEAALREQTNVSIGKAEANLQRVSGRRLNAAQNDMAEKVRGYLGQAREAAQSGDWFRAQNLASKAEVLSEELVKSR